jgi:hypothetical protein
VSESADSLLPGVPVPSFGAADLSLGKVNESDGLDERQLTTPLGHRNAPVPRPFGELIGEMRASGSPELPPGMA